MYVVYAHFCVRVWSEVIIVADDLFITLIVIVCMMVSHITLSQLSRKLQDI